ncbi:MAG: prephenate dehydratase [Gordonia sp. (in: high G+C Gram-positive bacteria)]|uniref:prephenate dehydratase n=1 Tax=Gordonia sp. (in: high G+C Gram-positive bacteria) TaxID=84139 RepID=UPI0039E59ABB
MTAFAYFGPAGTFTEMALNRLLERGVVPTGGEVTTVAADSPAAAAALVRDGRADYACVPIESSLEGSVPATMDALTPDHAEQPLQAYAEVALDIAFTIAARESLRDDDVHTIAAYPVASAQVRDSVAARFPHARFVPASSNAGAARDVADGHADAAVTTPIAAGLHHLTPLCEGVVDSEAVTRFLLIGRAGAPTPRTGTDRTSVILDLANVPGSLVNALSAFADRDVDLTRIESRPRGAGQYRFFLDAAGHLDDPHVSEVLDALEGSVDRVVYLGSWPVDERWLQLLRQDGD